MSILVDKSTKVITQGMTGDTGTFHEAKANFETSIDAVKELLVACKGIDGSLA